MHVVLQGSPDYPESLEDLPQPPKQLFMIGEQRFLEKPIVAIVGTRDPTAYGVRTARSIASAMAEAGIGVVSGMARGIDSVAHRTTLEGKGRTIAVLGTGVDVPYPAGHRELHRVIGARGLLVSEYDPGARAHRGAFPKRNRIIAALARVTIVVEAGHRSGALNTARHALELQRSLGAVPGPIDSPQSEGTNQLLRDGASVIATVADALTLMGVTSQPQRRPIHLSEVDGAVWSALAGGPLTVDTLAARTSVSARECLSAITSLELKGMVECLVTGEVRRR